MWSRSEQVLNNPAPAKAPTPAAEQAPASGNKPAPLKLKVKPAKSVTIDNKPTELVPPMAPPPVPKKRKEPSKSISDLDDMLGAEVDAMSRSGRDNVSDAFEQLLDQPKPKKVKLPMPKPAGGQEKDKGEEKKKAKARDVDSGGTKQATPPVAKPKPAPTPAPAAAPPPAAPETQSAEYITVPPPPPGQAFPNYVQPRPPPDLPPTVSNTMPFKLKRARPLLSILTKDPNSIFVSVVPLSLLQRSPERSTDPSSFAQWIPSWMDYLLTSMKSRNRWISKRLRRRLKGRSTRRWVNLPTTLSWCFRSEPAPAFGFDLKAGTDDSCRKFNNPGDSVTLMADAVEAVYWREWPKVVSSRMTPGEKKDMAALLNKLLKDNMSLFFREAGESRAGVTFRGRSSSQSIPLLWVFRHTSPCESARHDAVWELY